MAPRPRSTISFMLFNPSPWFCWSGLEVEGRSPFSQICTILSSGIGPVCGSVSFLFTGFVTSRQKSPFCALHFRWTRLLSSGSCLHASDALSSALEKSAQISVFSKGSSTGISICVSSRIQKRLIWSSLTVSTAFTTVSAQYCREWPRGLYAIRLVIYSSRCSSGSVAATARWFARSCFSRRMAKCCCSMDS